MIQSLEWFLLVLRFLSYANSFFLLIDTRWQYKSHNGISWIGRICILCRPVLSQIGFEESQCRFVNYDLYKKSVLIEGLFWLFSFSFFEKKTIFIWFKVNPNSGTCFSLWTIFLLMHILCAAQSLTHSRHVASHTEWLLFSWTLKEEEVACQLQEGAGVWNQITGGIILIS